MEPCIYSQLSFDIGTKVVQWGKESTVNPYIHMENTYLISDLTPYTKLTLLEENQEENLCDLGLGKDFSDKTQKPSKEKKQQQKPDLPKFRPFMP